MEVMSEELKNGHQEKDKKAADVKDLNEVVMCESAKGRPQRGVCHGRGRVG